MKTWQVDKAGMLPICLRRLEHKNRRGNVPVLQKMSLACSIFRQDKADNVRKFLCPNQKMYQLCMFQYQKFWLILLGNNFQQDKICNRNVKLPYVLQMFRRGK